MSQLQHEDDKLVEQIEVLSNAEITIGNFVGQAVEQSQMLEEDMQCGHPHLRVLVARVVSAEVHSTDRLQERRYIKQLRLFRGGKCQD